VIIRKWANVLLGNDLADPTKLDLPENKLKKAKIRKIEEEMVECDNRKSDLDKRRTEILSSIYGSSFGTTATQGTTASTGPR
jgi:hypothetical protein